MGIIEGFGVDNENGNVLIKIGHSLNWENAEKSFQVLKYKALECVKIIKSENFLDEHPEFKEKKLEIKIYLKHDLNKLALEYINNLYIAVGIEGIELSYEIKSV